MSFYKPHQESQKHNQWPSNYKSKHKDSLNTNKRLEAWAPYIKQRTSWVEVHSLFSPQTLISQTLFCYLGTIIWLKHRRFLHWPTPDALLYYFSFCRFLCLSRLTSYGHLGIRPSGNPLPKKPHSMRVWVRSLG